MNLKTNLWEEEEATETEGPQQRGAQGEAGWGHVNVELISPLGVEVWRGYFRVRYGEDDALFDPPTN